MRRMFVSRSSLEKPRPLERFVRTSSPSNTSSLIRCWLSSFTNAVVSVVFPAPDNPVIHNVNPFFSNMIPAPFVWAALCCRPLFVKLPSRYSNLEPLQRCSIRLDQHTRDFWPGKLNRWQLTRTQELTHF